MVSVEELIDSVDEQDGDNDVIDRNLDDGKCDDELSAGKESGYLGNELIYICHKAPQSRLKAPRCRIMQQLSLHLPYHSQSFTLW